MHGHATLAHQMWGAWDWLCYVVYGNGLWMNSWHCSGEDAVAMLFRAACCLYMAIGYARYARQWKINFQDEPESPTKTHAMWLRAVFLWCLCIHIVGSIVFLVVPMHYAMGVMFLINGYQCHMLCRSNLQRLTHQRWHAGELAIGAQDALYTGIDEAERIIAKEEHARQIEVMTDTTQTLKDVRDTLETTRRKLDATRNTKFVL